MDLQDIIVKRNSHISDFSQHYEVCEYLYDLYPSSRFTGVQKSRGQSYKVEVKLDYVDVRENTLCGYLSIDGLTDEYPKLTTFFTGEIISEKFPFITRKWEADVENDLQHWSKFAAFSNWKETCRDLENFDYKALKESSRIFMRWKERYLIPNHQVKDIQGASFAGFYYICYEKLTGKIEGYYFHRQSERFQSLILNHVNDHRCSPIVYIF